MSTTSSSGGDAHTPRWRSRRGSAEAGANRLGADTVFADPAHGHDPMSVGADDLSSGFDGPISDLEDTHVLPQRDPSLARWSDPDAHISQGPPVAFRTNPADTATDALATVGFIGRYALKYPIGEGGLGTVYAAHDPLLSRLIAIKTLRLQLSEEARETFKQLFVNEARAAAGLSHPHIVTVYDAGLTDDGAYIAMELLKGRDLRLLRQEGWKPTITQAALIARRVADALAYAHSKGVVHRDIKPGNIFMVGRTQPRVLDFGIASVAHQHEARQPDADPGGDLLAGSPYYMAPEQVRHDVVDKRADVFSLGVVLYELLTDRRPFTGETVSAISEAVLAHEPVPAHEVDPDVPKALSEIAQRAMAKLPDERYRSARAMARDLRHWLEEQATQGESAEETTPPAPAAAPSWIRPAAFAGVALAAVAGVWALVAPSSDVAQRPAAVGGLVVTPAAGIPQAGASTTVVAPSTTDQPAAEPVATAQGTGADSSTVGARPTEPPDSGASLSSSTVPAVPAQTASASAAAEKTKQLARPSATSPASKPPRDAREAREAREVREAKANREARGRPQARAEARSAKEPARTAASPAGATVVAAAAAASTTAAGSTTTPAAVAPTGELRFAVMPWGDIEINGAPRGATPPMSSLRLPEGTYRVTIRNGDFPPYSTQITVTPGAAAVVRHRFGS